MYMSAEALGIKEWERTRLIELIDKLPTYVHVEDVDEEKAKDGLGFNMNYSVSDSYECGTVMCIGGACYIAENKINPLALTLSDTTNITSYVHEGRSEALDPLYFPHSAHDWNIITTEHAVQAIKNFLTYGTPKWAEIMGIEDEQEYE